MTLPLPASQAAFIQNTQQLLTESATCSLVVNTATGCSFLNFSMHTHTHTHKSNADSRRQSSRFSDEQHETTGSKTGSVLVICLNHAACLLVPVWPEETHTSGPKRPEHWVGVRSLSGHHHHHPPKRPSTKRPTLETPAH